MIEREVKLLFADPDQARRVIVAAGATPLRARRLQDDALFDTEAQTLGRRGCALRIRNERQAAGAAPDVVLVTFKGPIQPGTMKTREEVETVVGDGDVLARVFDALGLRVWFRYQKYREEFAAGGTTIAIDHTPVGTFVEIEGEEDAILAVAGALGSGPADFILDSYRTLFLKRREQFGVLGEHMVFAAE